jgi:hypothetical protein
VCLYKSPQQLLLCGFGSWNRFGAPSARGSIPAAACQAESSSVTKHVRSFGLFGPSLIGKRLTQTSRCGTSIVMGQATLAVTPILKVMAGLVSRTRLSGCNLSVRVVLVRSE